MLLGVLQKERVHFSENVTKLSILYHMNAFFLFDARCHYPRFYDVWGLFRRKAAFEFYYLSVVERVGEGVERKGGNGGHLN